MLKKLILVTKHKYHRVFKNYINKWQWPALGARSGGSKNVTYRQQTT